MASRRSPSACKRALKVASIVCALFLMFLYNTYRKPGGQYKENAPEELTTVGKDFESKRLPSVLDNSSINYLSGKRHLLSYTGEDVVSTDFNCTAPRDEHVGYNNSCDFILDQCGDELQLFNYLKLVLCNLSEVQVSSSIFLMLPKLLIYSVFLV